MQTTASKLEYKSLWNSFLGGLTIGLKRQKAWRVQLITWLLADAVRLFVMAILLGIAARGGQINTHNIILYYTLLVIFVRLVTDFSYEYLTREIVFGQFSNYLLRPGHYLSFILGDAIAMRIYGFFITIPFTIILIILLQNGTAEFIDFSWVNVSIAVLLVPLAFLINFLMGNIFALVAFHIKQIFGLKALYRNFIMVLGGEFLPLQILPVMVFSVIAFLPFRYGISFPIEVFMGWLTVSEIWFGLIVALVWILVLIGLYIWLYRKSVVKFEAEGL